MNAIEPRLEQIALDEIHKLSPNKGFLAWPTLPKFIDDLLNQDRYTEIEAWWRRRVRECLVVTSLYKIELSEPVIFDEAGEWVFPRGIRYDPSMDALMALKYCSDRVVAVKIVDE